MTGPCNEILIQVIGPLLSRFAEHLQLILDIFMDMEHAIEPRPLGGGHVLGQLQINHGPVSSGFFRE